LILFLLVYQPAGAFFMTPFTIDVDESVLSDLQERLNRTRFPDQLENTAWEYGTDLAYLKDLVEYWKASFDWRAAEAELNWFSHFKTDIDGLNIHYIHERSPHDNALPLIITHGWPGSIFEFHKIIRTLTHPDEFGGSADDAFHVVCPSIAGYGFSDAAKEPGFDVKSMAEVNVQLMAKLGYQKYGAQGGDWGSVITGWTGALDPKHCCGIHMNMVLGYPPRGDDARPDLTEEETDRIKTAKLFQKEETGYQRIQGTKPQTLGYGLMDSPAGLAAWITEKFRTWSDCGGNVETRFTKDELLTNIMIYWVTGTITSSTRLYFETYHAKTGGAPTTYVDVPTGFAAFPRELAVLPRAWAEKSFNVTHWTEMPKGGHFAALEEPELLVDDIRTFFRDIRS
jgi:microsomal epoxide hydrolase